MENSPYTAPQAELIDQENVAAVSEHYVLPQSKLWIFGLLSLGLFLLPWNYIHWRRIKHSEGSNIWPAPRSLFSIFFINALFKEFERGRIKIGADYNWSPATNAGFFILFSVIGNVLDQVYSALSATTGFEYWLIFTLTIIVPIWNISNAQRAANMAANDPKGDSNKKWTIGNALWLVACIAIWALVYIGLFYGDI